MEPTQRKRLRCASCPPQAAPTSPPSGSQTLLVRLLIRGNATSGTCLQSRERGFDSRRRLHISCWSRPQRWGRDHGVITKLSAPCRRPTLAGRSWPAASRPSRVETSSVRGEGSTVAARSQRWRPKSACRTARWSPLGIGSGSADLERDSHPPTNSSSSPPHSRSTGRSAGTTHSCRRCDGWPPVTRLCPRTVSVRGHKR